MRATEGDEDRAAAGPTVRGGWNTGWGGGSGADVAWVFHRALALVFLIAWVSLGAQVRVLIGSRGLLPFADFLAAARAQGALSMLHFPTLLALAPGDGALVAGTVVGAALALLALAGVGTRVCVALQTILYLSYATACRSFLGFQWDNLLLECGLLATFLPVDRAAPVAHFLFRALLFKLYFESGIAKWQSPIHDWQDGSAMTYYYETAPLPTALAWYGHHLPRAWHLFESRATLALELGVPFLAFGPRRARLGAAALFTLFQVLNAATANYGFFCYLAATLHLFLLDERDVRRARAWRNWSARHLTRAGWLARVRARAAPERAPDRAAPGTAAPPPPRAPRGHRRLRRAAAGVAVAGWLFVSAAEAYFYFGAPGAGAARIEWVLELSETFRLVTTYHLFAAVTRERIEPEFQVEVDGAFVPLEWKYKAGAPARAPRFVAPHQPRVDFLLWFYGLAFTRGAPPYVHELLARLCEDPDAVASLFTTPPPRKPRAVRIVFWDYRFTSPDEKRATSAWWTRRQLQSTPALACPS